MTQRVEKENLRRRIRTVRAAMSSAQRAAASAAVGTRLTELLQSLSSHRPLETVAVYLAKAEEANIDVVAEWLMARGVHVVAPRSVTADEPPFYSLRSLREGLTIAAFGVRVPQEFVGGRVYGPEDVDLVLAPGLAFDREGGRLGFGIAWYDRMLPRAPLSIGICFDCQLVERVPREEHDRGVAMIVTETQTIDVAHK
ncbi:MAG: 5-formyltetrahydrofolate cyclo-ligase [Armatimonadota bacterium]|nr:5-formyltetrahydrofolate cyclo-ligase [Armatimonadota bacterium]